jgi:hypothetical protein
MAFSNSATLVNVPRLMRLSVISAKKRSTRVSHDDEVGMKCSLKRGCLPSQHLHLRGLVRPVVDEAGAQTARDTFNVSNDPHFEEKVADVVGLYMRPPDKAMVLCVDEKSQIQALDRTQPGLPTPPRSRPTSLAGIHRTGRRWGWRHRLLASTAIGDAKIGLQKSLAEINRPEPMPTPTRPIFATCSRASPRKAAVAKRYGRRLRARFSRNPHGPCRANVRCPRCC